jgi:hypothetical protein
MDIYKNAAAGEMRRALAAGRFNVKGDPIKMVQAMIEVIPLFRKAIMRLPELVSRPRRSFAGLSLGCACRFTANKGSAHQSELPFPALRKTRKEKGSPGGHGVHGRIEQCFVLLPQAG